MADNNIFKNALETKYFVEVFVGNEVRKFSNCTYSAMDFAESIRTLTITTVSGTKVEFFGNFAFSATSMEDYKISHA